MARRIELKIEKIEIEGVKTDFNYSKQIIGILNRAGNEGFTTEQIRKNLKIIDRLEMNGDGQAVKDHVVLEEAEWENLKQRLAVFRWGTNNHAITNLEDAILGAKEIAISGGKQK